MTAEESACTLRCAQYAHWLSTSRVIHNSQSCNATGSFCVGRSCTCDQDAFDGSSLHLVLQGLEDNGHHLGLQVASQPALEKSCVHPGLLPRPVPAPQY